MSQKFCRECGNPLNPIYTKCAYCGVSTEQIPEQTKLVPKQIQSNPAERTYTDKFQKSVKRKGSSEKRKITYGRKIKYDWDIIEEVNGGLGVTREKCQMDHNGYLRWTSTGKLVHRDIAFTHIFKQGKFDKKYSEYDVHHKDGNRINNQPDNLEILTREEHEGEHGSVIFEGGKKYVRIARESKKRQETDKAIFIGSKYGKWYPKSQLLSQDGYIYGTEWIVNLKSKEVLTKYSSSSSGDILRAIGKTWWKSVKKSSRRRRRW